MNLTLEVEEDFTATYSETTFSFDGSRFGVTHSGGLKVWRFEQSEAGVESFRIHEAADAGK